MCVFWGFIDTQIHSFLTQNTKTGKANFPPVQVFAIFFLNMADHKKVIAYFPHDYHALLNFFYSKTFTRTITSHKYLINLLNIWLNLDEKCGSSSLLKILTPEMLQSAPNYPKLNSGTNSTLNMQFLNKCIE